MKEEKAFIKHNAIYQSKKGGLKVKVSAINVSYTVVTEKGEALEATLTQTELWKFRKEFDLVSEPLLAPSVVNSPSNSGKQEQKSGDTNSSNSQGKVEVH